MSLKLILNILFSLLSFQKDVFGKKLEINFIKDFLNVEFHSVQVNAFLCWDKNDSLKLSEQLFQDNIRISIHNTLQMSLTYYAPSPDLLFLLDGNCELSSHMLFLANMQRLFAAPYKWLLLSDNFENYKKMHDLDKLDILLDSFFYLGQKISENEYSLNEVFKFNKTGMLVNRVIDTWSNKHGFHNHTLPTVLSVRRLNIMGTKIIGAVVITNNETFKHLYDYREKQVDSNTKLNFNLVNIMIEYFNGTKEFEFYDNWGVENPSERFNTGMVGALRNGDAEIGGSAFIVRSERLQAIDYMSYTTKSYLQFVYIQPPLSYVTNLFTLPFSRTVWLSIAGLFVVAVMLIYFVTLWERRNMEDQKKEDDSFLEVIMLAIGAVCQQGTTYEPKSGTGQIITILIFVALLFIYVSYSAYIVVLLQSTSPHIQTVDDLLKSKMDCGLIEQTYNHLYFQYATEPTRKALYEKKIKPKGDKAFMSLDDGVKRIREGFFAFHGETPPIYTVIRKTFFESEKCNLQTLQYVEGNLQGWLPCRKNSSYKEIFKISLRKLAEFGIQSREWSRLYDMMPKCAGKEGNFVSVGLVDAGPAFAFLGAGFAVAVSLFLLEHAVHRATCCRLTKLRKKSQADK